MYTCRLGARLCLRTVRVLFHGLAAQRATDWKPLTVLTGRIVPGVPPLCGVGRPPRTGVVPG